MLSDLFFLENLPALYTAEIRQLCHVDEGLQIANAL